MSDIRKLLVIVLVTAVVAVWATVGMINYLGSSGKAVASVDGKKITEAEFIKALKEGAGRPILDQLISEILIENAAATEKISISQEDIDNRLAEIRSAYPSEDFFKAALKQNNLTEQTLKERIRLNLVLEALATRDVTVTDDELRQYYDENTDEFVKPEQVHARHILVNTREEAEEILKQLQGGSDFAELAKERSTDAVSAEQGGDLGFVQRGEMVKAFEDAVFAMSPGQIEGPVETEFGYHVIKVEEKRDATQATFEEAREEIRDTLLAEKATPIQLVIEDLRSKAKVEIFWKDYGPLDVGTSPH